MIIAHRGVHDNKNGVPENSMVAFSKAIEKDYAIEFDIEITKDDKLVIHHDDNLKRMTGIDKNVEDMMFDEVRSLKLLNTKEVIPTFREVLELVNGKVFLDIEIKSTKRRKKVIELVLKELETYNGEVSLKSFDPFIVKDLKKETNKYKIGLLVMEKSASKKLNFLVKTGLIYKIPYDFISVDSRMFNDEFYDKFKDKSIQLWRVNYKNKDKYSKYDVTLICDNLY